MCCVKLSSNCPKPTFFAFLPQLFSNATTFPCLSPCQAHLQRARFVLAARFVGGGLPKRPLPSALSRSGGGVENDWLVIEH
jgi:hypothetical protein